VSFDRAAYEHVEQRIHEAGVEYINLQFSDIVGSVKQVSIPVAQWPHAVQRGVWFDGSSIEGFARIAESDMYLVPDLETFAVIPWEQDGLITARVICDVYTPSGEPFSGDPRYVLKQAIASARELGYEYNTGPELEFYLFRTDDEGCAIPIPHDSAGYFDVSTDLAHNVRGRMGKALEAFGIQVEAAHHEVAGGQHEIDFRYGPALTAADNAVTFRVVLKAIAQLNGLFASFMPKPIAGVNGSGMHTHQSLAHLDSGENAFHDGDHPFGLSDVAHAFVAGQLAHARGMAAILAPLVNSYKRLVPGYEAPVYISWARVNRSALIRVPQYSVGCPDATRVELRCPDPSCNPYLAFAVMLHAGLDGIRRGLTPPEPAEEDLYGLDAPALDAWETLPGSLGEALEDLESDLLIREALGDHVYQRFIAAKRREWNDYRISVSQWEVDRYLPVY
jgi:glutamine synthetase